MKTFDILTVITADELIAIRSMTVDAIQTEIVEPLMPVINQLTGQENDPRYFAYIMQAAAQALYRQTRRKRRFVHGRN